MKSYVFKQIDSWFFRESRAMDGSGATALSSVFPPSNNTLIGAIRAQIGNNYNDEQGTTWAEYRSGEIPKLNEIIGSGHEDLGALSFQGIFLYDQKKSELYLPLPLNVVEKSNNNGYGFFDLSEDPIKSDLGDYRLPKLVSGKKDEHGVEQRDTPIEHAYVSVTDFEQILQNKPPKNVVEFKSLFKKEPRLGIGCDNKLHKVVEGKLYQTIHLRLLDDWALYVGIDIESDHHKYLPQNTILRLGGEARMAQLEELPQAVKLPKAPKFEGDKGAIVLMLYLITPLPSPQQNRADENYIKGKFIQNFLGDELAIEVISAVVGKPERIGGWDLKNHKSLPVRSFIPAGSCWYLQCESKDAAQIINKLHTSFLTSGTDKALGYGQVLVGLSNIKPNK